MKIDVSNGEIVDKLCILTLKLKHITDATKLRNVQAEYDMLLPIVESIIDTKHTLFIQLLDVNEALWHIEDKCRLYEAEKIFDERFIENARQVYITNDERARVKKEINIYTNSDLIEEKSYQ